MNKEEIGIRYRKLAPWLKLSLLTAGALGGLAFALFLSGRIVSWHESYFRNLAVLRSPLPVTEEHSMAESPDRKKGKEEKESASMGSYSVRGNARKTWNWPDDLSLKKKALASFSRAKKWDTALWIGANLGHDTVFQDEVFQLVEQSYLAHAGSAVEAEKKEMQAQKAANTIFDRAVFLVNFRIRLEKTVKVSSIAEIMTTAYFEAVSDPFVKYLADNPEWRSRREMLRYGSEADDACRTLIGNDLNSMPYYMKTRWDMFHARLAEIPEFARNLNAAPATEHQRNLMRDFSSKKRSGIEAGEYAALPPLWRWFFGKAAIEAFAHGANAGMLEKVFDGNINGLEWMNALKKGIRLSPEVRAFFRSRPQWQEAMNARNYEAALAVFLRDAESVIPGGTDENLENDLRKMAALEQSLMKNYFPDGVWEEACRRKTETRTSARLSTKDFIDIVKRRLKEIPETEIGTEQKKAFLALCYLNRGRNARSVYLLAETTNESLINHHIPAEELNHE